VKQKKTKENLKCQECLKIAKDQIEMTLLQNLSAADKESKTKALPLI